MTTELEALDKINEAIIAALIAARPRYMKRIQDIHIPERGKPCVELWLGEASGYRTISTYPLAQAALRALMP